ncbi:MAG: hypothetical protein ACJZ9G_02880 [Rhodospirillales bacterium]
MKIEKSTRSTSYLDVSKLKNETKRLRKACIVSNFSQEKIKKGSVKGRSRAGKPPPFTLLGNRELES